MARAKVRGTNNTNGKKRNKPRHSFQIKPITDGQRAYIQSINDNVVTFCDGAAGTGKTLLATGAAMKLLQEQSYSHIIIVRPAIEACGEKLGYLPGGFEDKMRPYIQPIVDNLRFFLNDEGYITTLFETNIIEISPIAYLRGRTFNNSVVIFDEAQNSTIKQMKLFLTRIGRNCKVIVEGDSEQSDLDREEVNGLGDAMRRFTGVPRIGQVKMGHKDIVRSEIVGAILERY